MMFHRVTVFFIGVWERELRMFAFPHPAEGAASEDFKDLSGVCPAPHF